MAITQAVCNSFKSELMQAMHNFTTSTGHAFKIALYTSAAALDASTTVYSTSSEVIGTGYTAGGTGLTNVTPVLSGSTAYTDFNPDITWGTSTITARGALIYNTNGSFNKAVVVLDFGADKSSSSGDFTVIFPPPAAGTAIIRIA